MGTASKIIGVETSAISKLGGVTLSSAANIGGQTIVTYSNTKSLEFGGSNEIVDCGEPSFLASKTKVSISMFLKLDSTTNQTIAGVYPGNLSSPLAKWFGFQYSNSAYAQKMAFIISNGSNYPYGKTTVSMPQDEWFHFVGVFDGSGAADADRCKMWVNGTQDTLVFPGNSIPTATYAYGSSDWPLWLGSSGYNTNPPTAAPFLGEMDEVAIWTNTALDSTMVNAIKDQGGSDTPGDLKNLSGVATPTHYWRLGDKGTFADSEWTFPDQVGSRNITTVNMEEGDVTTDVPPTP